MTEISISVCPVCTNELNNQNRLITEDCGHSKCRQCLIAEPDGCKKCKEDTFPCSNPNNQLFKSELLKTNTLIIDKHQKEPKNLKTSISAHIVSFCSDDNKIIYHCTICNKNFKSRSQQYYHKFCNNSSSKPFKCDECSKAFLTSAHLKYHKSGHLQESFQCSICCKMFSKIQILQKHEKIHKAISEECTECGARLRNKEALASHLKRHQNILPFECDKCDKKFSLQASLRSHQQVVHIAAKKFKCNRCEKVFNRNSSLKTHEQKHINRKKHSCSKCLRHFNDTKSLLRHSRIHLGKNKFKCTLCDTTSIRKDNILRHIRNMHPNEKRKSCIEEIREEFVDSENEESDIEDVLLKEQVPAETTRSVELIAIVPQIIANTSVIRSIGNVIPVTIVEEEQSQSTQIEGETLIVAKPNKPTASIQKKIKKYDPREMYRKILLDDDSTLDNDTNSNSEVVTNPTNDQTKEFVQETTVICNGQQSNFSETHWRKNFKYNYQIQFD